MIPVRLAATVVVFRRTDAVEVLLGLRPPGGVFGGIWAFPGGAVEPEDHDVERMGFDDALRAAALRETAEEVGIFLTDPPDLLPPSHATEDTVADVRLAGGRFDPGRLQYLSNWVTPEWIPRRFDTHFYLAEVDPGTALDARTEEFEQVEWVRPADAIAEARSGSRPMMPPTTWHLQLLADVDDPWSIPPRFDPLPPVTGGMPDVLP